MQKINKSPNKITDSTGGENSEKVHIPDPQILSYEDLSKLKEQKEMSSFNSSISNSSERNS